MEKCLHCSKELKHVPGRKQKSFCDVNCRNKYFYAKRKALIAAGLNPEKEILKAIPVITPRLIDPMPIEQAVALHNAENPDQFTTTHLVSKKKLEALNGPYDAPPLSKSIQDEFPKIQPLKPKNLDELKALCPFPEKTLERSDWIRTERQKYGI